jgi:hypothetical protein
MANPLDKLFEDGNALDTALLADIVFPRARIYVDRGTQHIRFTAEGDKLSVKEKVLIYLLARKALVLKDTEGKTVESASPSEMEKVTGIAGGTLRPALRKLVDDRLLIQEGRGGGYSVPNYALNTISQILPPEEADK